MDPVPILFHYFPMKQKAALDDEGRGEPFLARIPLADPEFPFRAAHIKPLGVDYDYLHRHPEFEICYFPVGRGAFMIQEREFPIRAGDVFIVNANDIHQPVLGQRDNEGAIVTYFCGTLFADPLEKAEWLSPFLFANQFGFNRVSPDPRLCTLIEDLHREAKAAGPHWRLTCRGLLTHILSIVARDFAAKCEAQGVSPRLRQVNRFAKVVAYINENVHMHIEGATLYRLAALSHSQFCAQFRDAFGMNVSAYIQCQRVKRAKRLLISTPMRITEIAFACGFRSSSFFSTVFKKHTNVSPTEFREGRCR